MKPNTVHQTHDIHGRIQHLSQEEQEAYGTAELRPKGSRDEIVSPAAFDFAVGRDGREAQGGQEIYAVCQDNEA